jgi:hypothetical protein
VSGEAQVTNHEAPDDSLPAARFFTVFDRLLPFTTVSTVLAFSAVFQLFSLLRMSVV